MKKWVKVITYVIVDICAIAFSWMLAVLLLRYDFPENMDYNKIWFVCSFPVVCVTNALLGLYGKAWKYASITDGIRVILAAAILGAYCFIAAYCVKDINEQGVFDLTVEWAVITTFLYLAFLSVSRFLYRINSSVLGSGANRQEKKSATRVMIIGAGAAGAELIRELNKPKTQMNAVCLIDDDKKKLGLEIGGVRVVGTTEQIEENVNKYGVEQIIIAMPSIKNKKVREIVEECQKTSCKVKIIPGISQLAKGEVSISKIKDVSINDLLGRDSVKVNLDEIMGYIENKTVLVTGGGGSIGSELCRQIAKHNPHMLIILDIYENNAYDIEQELKRKYTDLNLVTLIASVRDGHKIDTVFEKYKPEIVFHAAAHKHVPLMETSPNEAVKNNVGGTFNVADAAGRFGAKRFILISTDKAVNPTNVMGATKRICEMIVQAMDKKYQTEYVAVRFGNVLGSNGSVIPLFKKQIEEGGPVTVTHENIVRYFMTIPEAVSLVLQAGAYAKGGEIFVLDMGEPVRIYDLAINLIKLSGLEPFEDIDVKITGLRPGEKLYEERLMDEEGLEKTQNKLISIGKPIKFNEKELFNNIEKLRSESYTEKDNIRNLIHGLVPTYKLPEKIGGGGANK